MKHIITSAMLLLAFPSAAGTSIRILPVPASPDTYLWRVQDRPSDGNYDQGGPIADRRFDYFNDAGTEAIVIWLLLANESCEALVANYRVDCLRFFVRKMAEDLPKRGDYLPVRRVLVDTERRLGDIVRQTHDPNARRIKPRLGGKPQAPRFGSLAAIRPEAVGQSNRQAEAVISEAATVLLRSAEGSAKRQVHFQKIAQALDSTKVLLRSS